MNQELEKSVQSTVKSLFGVDVQVELTRPEEQFGDFATNVALQLANKLSKNPREVADQLAEKLREALKGQVSDVQIAGAGFINLKLSDEALLNSLESVQGKTLSGQQILVEFGDPNPFKEMHIGHLYSYIVGDSIANVLKTAGANVKRLSYHGDVGLHVAKAIWGMQQANADLDKIGDTTLQNIGKYYAAGAKAYEEDEKAKEEIHIINEHVYKKDDSEINKLYTWGRDKSFGYFGQILEDLGIKNNKQYFESQTAEIGMDLVHQNTGKVFEESEGAIIYNGEKAGLHTRVFITSKGLPTYETKDLGLAELKRRDFPNAKRSIIITANEQAEYFKVMVAALAEFDQPLADSITHLSHGFVSLSTGKMSSRTGNVLSGVSAIVDIEQEIEKRFSQASHETRNAAIKYDFLKHRLGSNIVYDVSESFSLEGNSGPYIQYAHARARSILAKAKAAGSKQQAVNNLDSGEKSLARKLSEYTEIIDKAINELMPHHICTYLYELAQNFNRFYEHNRVIGDEREELRLQLVKKYAETLKSGLSLLGIDAPGHL